MKKFILIWIVFSMSNLTFGQGLNNNALLIKQKFPTQYDNVFKKYAIEKWKDDYEMVVYRINNQANACFGVLKELKKDNLSILNKALKKWAYKGSYVSNLAIFKKMQNNKSNLADFLSLEVDWEMVKYEYDNQVKAKDSF